MRLSPGPLIAAAFIGPGTVTTATLAGADYGYVLLWGIVFSALATIVLQEMAMRVGVVGREDLGGALRRKLGSGWAFRAIAGLVVLALGVGNAAYEGGNLAGAVLGGGLLLPTTSQNFIVGVVLGVTACLLAFGEDGPLRAVLTAAVALMSLMYIVACLVAPVDWGAALRGVLQPRLPEGAELRLIGLIGTTVVPYNLFLHASTARDFYEGIQNLPSARRDLYRSVAIGATITLAMAVLAAALQHVDADISSGADLAAPLADVVGPIGRYVVGFGYLAAGLTSAVTAPLATALAIAGLFSWSYNGNRSRFRATWASVLLIGAVSVVSGATPVSLILVAQVANGLLLPIIAACVLWVANDSGLLGGAANGRYQNALGLVVTALTCILSGRVLYNIFVA